MTRSWAIIGCGYVGTRLAKVLLSRGCSVTATRRSAQACEALQSEIPGARCVPYTLGKAVLEPADVVVISAPPGEDAPRAEAEFAKLLPPTSRLIYLSTTGVYAPGNGQPVTDTHPLQPASARGQARLAVETALQNAHPNCVALRIPGIYGPNRGVHQRMLQGNYRLIGAADTRISRIYVDDLVDAIILLGHHSNLAHSAYVIGDDEPTSAKVHALGIAGVLQLPDPPNVPLESVSLAVQQMLGADRSIVPKRLHALGWRPRYSNWRSGLAQALSEEAQTTAEPAH